MKQFTIMSYLKTKITLVLVLLLLGANFAFTQVDVGVYLSPLKEAMKIQWPNNRTIRIVFHGHSVPAGYFKNGLVKSLESYPYLTLKKLNEVYPYALINPIVTAIGGEASEQGSQRFENDILDLEPDLILIDYSLNDRRLGLEKAKRAWASMIQKAKLKGVKVILLTPTPDLSEDILDENTLLALHAEQVRTLASEFHVGLVDSYELFKEIAGSGLNLESYMSQSNHVNGLGHDLVANEIVKWFLPEVVSKE